MHRARLLLINEYNEIVREFTLDQPNALIGRSSQAHVFLDEHEVSRFHAQILQTADGFFVSDMGSTNGTHLNGQLIESNHLFPLSSNDHLSFGSTPFLFQIVPISIPQPNFHQATPVLISSVADAVAADDRVNEVPREKVSLPVLARVAADQAQQERQSSNSYAENTEAAKEFQEQKAKLKKLFARSLWDKIDDYRGQQKQQAYHIKTEQIIEPTSILDLQDPQIAYAEYSKVQDLQDQEDDLLTTQFTGLSMKESEPSPNYYAKKQFTEPAEPTSAKPSLKSLFMQRQSLITTLGICGVALSTGIWLYTRYSPIFG